MLLAIILILVVILVILAIIAGTAALLGAGVALVTADPGSWWGWVLIVIAASAVIAGATLVGKE